MDIIEEIIKTGVLIEPEVALQIRALKDEQRKLLLEKIKAEKPLIINKEYLEKILKEPQQKQSYSVQDFVNALNEYYESAKNIFLGKNLKNLVSIANCSGEATIIGLVKKAEEGRIELEDPTGSIEVVCRQTETKNIREDDVIAVSGFAKNGSLKADKIYQASEEIAKLKQKFPLLFKR